MATINVGPVTAGQTVTQAVTVGDTLVVTVSGPGPFDGASSTTQTNISSVVQTGTKEYTLSGFTANTTYTFITDDDDGDPYTVTGSVSAAPTNTDYFVDVYADIEVEQNQTLMFLGVSGTGAALVGTSPLELQPGDRVGFRKIVTSLGGGATPPNTGLATGFASTHWTDTSALTLTSSYQYKTIKTGVSLTVTDAVTISVSSGSASESDILYYRGRGVDPDLTVDISDSNIEISGTATSFVQTISNTSGSSSDNSSITEYRVTTPGGEIHESRTGYGSITVSDVPPNPGFPKTYQLEARVTTSNGGSGLYKPVAGSTFTVIATTAQTENSPTLDGYGLAIFDHNSNLVTSFTSGHTVLRKIFTSSLTTISTTSDTDIDTGLTGITSSNSVILLEGDNSSPSTAGSKSIPATFVTGGNGNIHVRIAKVTVAQSVRATVLQYSGETIGGNSTSYGIKIKNGNNDTVIDESSTVYCVKEIVDIDASQSNQTLYQNSSTYFIYLTLTQGRYPGSSGPPIPAIRCSSSNLIIPPQILGIKHSDGSYKTVFMLFPKNVPLSNYQLALLVPQDATTPEYYGGSADQYGMAIRNSSGVATWRSDWRQAIVNNVIPANQFTQGTNQNGDYDVTTGYDGVLPPYSTLSDFEAVLASRDTTVPLTGLNEMDPANSFVSGNLASANIEYFGGRWLDFEFGTDISSGGGVHKLAFRIDGFTTGSLATYRYRDGSTDTTNYGGRSDRSHHPEGNLIIFRII